MKKLLSSYLVRSFFTLSGFGLLALPVGFYGMYLYIAPSLPDVSALKQAPLLKPMQVYTLDNQLIAEFGSKLSLPVEYENIPQEMIHAFLAAEDSSFFEHGGISFKSLGRAVSESITGADRQSGGSTITMQVAKNYFLSPEQTFRRKITEIFLARHIEENLTKDEIFTLYVNKIFLGKNAYGIQAAAHTYYSKTLEQLTIAEMAMIAGLPKAPSKYNPVINPERALERRNWIIGRMYQLAYITREQYEQAIAEPINLNMPERKVVERFPYISEMVRAEMVKQFGEQVIDSGFKIYTTIDSVRQQYAEDAVRKRIKELDGIYGWQVEARNRPLDHFLPVDGLQPAKVISITEKAPYMITAELLDGSQVTVPWTTRAVFKRFSGGARYGKYMVSNPNAMLYPKTNTRVVNVGDIIRLKGDTLANGKTFWSISKSPTVQAQLIAIHPNDGAVIAVVGGYSHYQSKFNRATQGWRQPGSIIKPLVYSLALDRGLTPNSAVLDAQYKRGWTPKGSSWGWITLRRALYSSRNKASVYILDKKVGVERAIQGLMDFGFNGDDIPRNLTIALGSSEVLPIQMATGYATFANGGYRIQPYFIKRIEDSEGKEIFKANPVYACISCIEGNQKITEMVLQQKFTKLDDKAKDKDKKNDKDKKKLSAEELKKLEAELKATEQELENQQQMAKDKPVIKAEYRQATRILKSQSAYDMANILRDVIRIGTGRLALRLGRNDIGGKTGTTNDAKDTWFAGFNGQVVTVVWVGFDQPTSLGSNAQGGKTALPLWTDFMGKALRGTPSSWVTLDKNAGDPLNKNKTEIDDQNKDNTQYSADAPPLAYPIYVAPTPSTSNSFGNTTASTTYTTRPSAPTRRKYNPEDDFRDEPDDDNDAPKAKPKGEIQQSDVNISLADAPNDGDEPRKAPATPPNMNNNQKRSEDVNLDNLLDGNM